MLLMKMETRGQMQMYDCSGAVFSLPTAQDLIAWMTADRAVECRCVVLAASNAFQTVLLELPNAHIIPSDTELVNFFLPAAVNVPAGTKLPLKDLEKLGLNTANCTGQDLNISVDERSLSLDLASEIVLDIFVKLVRKWEDIFTAIWTESQDNWDWYLPNLTFFVLKICFPR
jgi:hypothetical protein